jgi:NhaP-type Na+/H+ or K+/H+ antiporter
MNNFLWALCYVFLTAGVSWLLYLFMQRIDRRKNMYDNLMALIFIIALATLGYLFGSAFLEFVSIYETWNKGTVYESIITP